MGGELYFNTINTSIQNQYGLFTNPYMNINNVNYTNSINLFNIPFTNPIDAFILNTDKDVAGFNNFSLNYQLFNMYLNNINIQPYMPRIPDRTFYTETNLPTLKNVYNPRLSQTLANIAYKTAFAMDTKGWCAKGVMDALERAGISKNGETRVASAYQAVDKFRQRNDKFQEVKVPKKDLNNLPAGCIIVWDPYTDKNGNYHKHGHIAVTLGKNRFGVQQEASDHLQNLSIKSSQYHVFVPADNKKPNQSGKK